MSEFYGNTETLSMHRRLGSASLSQLAFPAEGNPNFAWEKSHWDNAFVKSKKQRKRDLVRCMRSEHVKYSTTVENYCPGKILSKKPFKVRR